MLLSLLFIFKKPKKVGTNPQREGQKKSSLYFDVSGVLCSLNTRKKIRFGVSALFQGILYAI